MLDQATIAGNLLDYWDANFTLEVATAFPGVPLDTHDLAEWIEVQLPETERCIGRDSSPQRREIAVNVHVFVRRTIDLARLHILAEAVLAVLANVTFPLYSTNGSETLLGYAEMREGRVTYDEPQELLRATVVVRGIAQES